MLDNAVIKVQNVSYSYKDSEGKPENLVLDGINVELRQGEFTAILGHNGSGKSTLAKHFNGILIPDIGNVTVFGMDTKNEELLIEIRRRTGLVFQNPDNQIVANVVEEDVAFAPENLGYTSFEIRKKVDDALKTVGMEGFSLHAPHLLSGGQKQRIAIAGVLAMSPQCVVFDEATAMLDPKGRRDVLDIIKLLRERGTTVVLITHHMLEAAEADRVIILSDGRLVLDGEPKKIFSQAEKMRELELDIPTGTALIYELNKEGIDIPLENLSVEDCAQAIFKAFSK